MLKARTGPRPMEMSPAFPLFSVFVEVVIKILGKLASDLQEIVNEKQ
jgi:hypothetical protein